MVFGYYSTALIAMAGLALASGVQFAVIGLWRQREPVYLSYAMLCLCIAGLGFFNARLDTATTLPAAVAALRAMITWALLSFVPWVVFVRAYTRRAGANPRLLWATAALTAWFIWINLSTPDTLLFSDLGGGAPIVLPWGEALFTLTGRPSPWGWLFHMFSYAVFVWALLRAWVQYREGERLRATLLGVCLLAQFAALLWGDLIVDALGYRYPYLDTFAFLPFVLLMGLSLAAQLHQRTLQLEQATHRLEAEGETRREAEMSLRHLAYHDALTGLPNRLHALDQLAGLHAEALASGAHGAALLIDLDNFKTINDALGHQTGDRMLEAIADRLLAAAPAGALLARLGGDEFVLLLGELSGDLAIAQADAQRIAVTVVAQLAQPIAVDSRVLAIGASVGVAVFPANEADTGDVLRRADIALYRAKAAGRNAVRSFLPTMQREADERLALERGLRTALERNQMATQFSLHFQPQVDRHGGLLGAEALLRWRHPQLGDVPPSVFIPLAEETGLIHALGSWVIDRACAHIRAWDRDEVAFGQHLAVNVSAWQLAHPTFAEQVSAQVGLAGVAPARLTLELTESALLHDLEHALATLRRLAQTGFRLALDDFGTGYSSLNYLQQLPLDELKIDRAFVSDLLPASHSPLAGFIIDIASRLGMTTVAEGVETEPQRLALEQLGCQGLQGYLICRPLDEAGFLRWLAEREPPAAPRQARA